MNTTFVASVILVCMYIVCPSMAGITTTAATLTDSSATTATVAGLDATVDKVAAPTVAPPTFGSLNSPDSLESLAAMFSSYPGMQQQLDILKQSLQAAPMSLASGAPTGSSQAASAMTSPEVHSVQLPGVFPQEVNGVQSAANFNLGNNDQTTGLISQIIQSVLQRILGNRGSTNTQPIPSPQPAGTGSTSTFGFGNMFNPFGFFGGSAMNPFGMLWPSMMFDAIDFI